MGVHGGPKISAPDGLVLSLDAGNPKGFDDDENLTPLSSQIGSTPTYSVGGIVGLNTTATTAPNGLSEASTLDNNGNTNNYVFGSSGVALIANTTYTYSIHIKQGTKPDFQITIDENGFGGKRYYSVFTYSSETVTSGITGATNDGVVVGSTATKLSNGWYRLSLTFRTSTTSVGGFVDMINRFGNTSGSNYLWGRQLEYGSSASPYYATSGSIKNRGTTLIDMTGRGNTGTLTNGPTYSSANGGSIVFDGTNDYVTFSSTSLNLYPITLSFWATPSGDVINKYVASSLNGYRVSFGTGGISGYYFKSGSDYTLNYDNSYGSGTLGVFSYGTMTVDATGVKFYINGQLVGSNSWTGAAGPPTTAEAFKLGVYSSVYRTGNIAQASIYNRALTASEVSQNFNATRGRFGI